MRKLLLLVLLWAAPAAAQRPAPRAQQVRNVVLMIGDGMGLGQVASLMIDEGYAPTSFDRAHSVALCKTYSANNRVTDSAAAATAMATGRKTLNSRVGMAPDGEPLANIVELARAAGLATGVVVTSHLADATPAGFLAHVPGRHDYFDIAAQIAALRPDVAAGGGSRYFAGREDGRNLVEELRETGCTCVNTPEAFYAADRMPLLGLFAETYMPMAPDRSEAYLERATTHTLDLLARNRKGFFALIEGSQIDGACHQHKTDRLSAEMHDFDRAVGCVFDFADRHPGTLVLVVADHETGGVSIVSNDRDFTAAESGVELRYSTSSHSGTPVVLYAYGAGAHRFGGVIENTDIFRLVRELLIERRK